MSSPDSPDPPEYETILLPERRTSSSRSAKGSPRRLAPTMYNFDHAATTHLRLCLNIEDNDASVLTAKQHLDAFFRVFPDYAETPAGVLLEKLSTHFVFYLQAPTKTNLLDMGVCIGQIKGVLNFN